DHRLSEDPKDRARLASVGRAHSVVEVRVVDGHGHPVAVGQDGEIIVKGPTVMAGYWPDPQAAASALRDGWLHTGDVGRIDAEGYLTLTDRSKDVIISGGSNIYPREVEEILLTHNSVSEVSVVGQRDAEWGEIVVAFVVARPACAPSDEVLDAHCLSGLARFKRPKRYIWLQSLYKNNYGKLLKTELRKLLE
ncbi:AMP-binding protein, partial [Rhizobiaceae sp. 2RAB30]